MSFRTPLTGLRTALKPFSKCSPIPQPATRSILNPRPALHPFSSVASSSSSSSKFTSTSRSPLPFSFSTSHQQWTKPQSPALSLLRRAFSSSRPMAVRSTYFPQGNKGGGGWIPPTPRGGWFSRLKRKLDNVDPMRIIYVMIGLNIGIYLLWQYAISSWTRFRDPSLYRFMSNNFILSEANIKAGRLWTLITNAFSHSSGNHILSNLLGLYFVAPAAMSVLSGSAFVGLYLTGGLVSALASLVWHRLRRDKDFGSQGASGAIYATLGFYGALFPTSTIYLFFLLPLQSWMVIAGIFAYDCYGALANPHSQTNFAGHVGGMACGLIAAYRFRRGGGMGGFNRYFRR